ncbi:MAG: hypothetical protein Q9M92_11190 [Enterobacterales bacterium]|nr:hypothetical protein [Enterobacterales bacterium]
MKTFFVSTIILVLFAYLAICSYFYFFQRSFLYFPQPANYVKAITTHFNNGKQELSGWVINPGKIIYYYITAGMPVLLKSTLIFLADISPDYTVYLIPYRGYGNNSGDPSEEALYSDALHVYDKLRIRV